MCFQSLLFSLIDMDTGDGLYYWNAFRMGAYRPGAFFVYNIRAEMYSSTTTVYCWPYETMYDAEELIIGIVKINQQVRIYKYIKTYMWIIYLKNI